MRLRTAMSTMAMMALIGSPAQAAELGDPAPPLNIKEWVKGDKVDLQEGKGKKVFVLEFWASRSDPCRASMRYLTRLQEKFKAQDVVVIGISAEGLDLVRPFVEKLGKVLGFVVALDDHEATTEAYMKAFKQEDLPTAFVIDKTGAIVWYGRPEGELELVLDQIVSGRFDAEATRKAVQYREKEEEETEKVFMQIGEYWRLAMNGESGRAEKLGEEIFESSKKRPWLMNRLAAGILGLEPMEARDLKLALQAAKAAVDETEGRNAGYLDTYAQALFDSGREAEAIECEKRAIAAVKEDPEMKKDLEATLKQYETRDAKGDKKGEKKDGGQAEKKSG